MELFETRWDWLWPLGPVAPIVAVLVLAVWLLGGRRRSHPRRLAVGVVVVMLALWPALAHYNRHYKVRYEVLMQLFPLPPDANVRLASNATFGASEKELSFHGNGMGSYVEWTGFRLPPGGRYFLEVEMWVSGGNLSRLSWSCGKGGFHPARSTDFQGIVKYTGLVPWYDSALHRYFVMLDECDDPLTAVRLAPSNVEAVVAITSARIVALAE